MIPTIPLSAFLAAQGYTQQINEALYKFLYDRGFRGQLNEMLYAFLGSLSYTGTLNERSKQWLDAGLVLPANSVRFLTDPHTIEARIVESNLSDTGANWASNGTSGTKYVSYATAPLGSRVRFTVTLSEGNWWWRHGTNILQTPVNAWNTTVPVAGVEVDYIVTQAMFDLGFMGVLTNSTISSIRIDNFRVTV